MTIYTDRITLVFPIAAKNRKAAASLQTLEISETGNEFEKLVPLDPALVSQYASQFNLPLLERVTELEADLATKTNQLEATTQAKTALDLQVATLTTEKESLTSQVSMLEAVIEAEKQKVITANATIATRDTAITANNSEIAGKAAIIELLTSEKAELTANAVDLTERLEAGDRAMSTLEQIHARELSELQAKIAFLESIRTYDPNQIKSKSFYDRISKDELFTLGNLALSDQTARGIQMLLQNYLAEEWQVLLNDPQVVGALHYLTAIGALAEGRVAEMTRPASREEAYIA